MWCWVRAQGCNGETGRTPSGLVLPLKGLLQIGELLKSRDLQISRLWSSRNTKLAVRSCWTISIVWGPSSLCASPQAGPLRAEGVVSVKLPAAWLDGPALFTGLPMPHARLGSISAAHVSLPPSALLICRATRGKRGWVRRFAGRGLLPCAASQGSKAPKGALAPSQRLARFLASPLNVKLLFIHLFILAVELPSPHVAVTGWHKDPVRLCPVPRGHTAAL